MARCEGTAVHILSTFHSLLSAALKDLLQASFQMAVPKEELEYTSLYLAPFCPALATILHIAHKELQKIEPK